MFFSLPNNDVSLVVRGLDETSKFSLLDEEKNVLSPESTELRQRQFYSGRLAAREAVSEISSELVNKPILKGEKGEPLWPDGLVGSISHVDKWAVACVGFSSVIRGI